uniref:DNA-directed RNA polymerase n=1 Tax=viral metagenome TaxID=1070528 RepID=A0A6C0BS55_9ZZZZ
MASTPSDVITKQKASRIIGIKFGIPSPEDIIKGSVVEITSKDTYINNKPVINGLYDPRMGVVEQGLLCPTDGLDYIQTPGYFGHIVLARPVFYIQYLTIVVKILRCVCIKCSKLLIDRNRYESFMELTSDQRWNKVFQLASKVKCCGDQTPNGCGCKQPSKIKKEGLATIIAEWDSIDGVDADESEKRTLTLTAELVQKLLKRVSDDDVSFMGFSPTFSRPDWMVCSVLAVPPPQVRPPVKHDASQRSEDDLTHILVNVIKTNTTLREKIQSGSSAKDDGTIDDWTTLLQYFIATMIDNNIPGVSANAQRSGRPFKSIKDRLNGKHGRVRGNLMGKRVDYSARSVITPDPNISILELGVPLSVAMKITKPVTVNKRNIDYMKMFIDNGPSVHPGANVMVRNGEEISLHFADKESIVLREGDIIHRHMMDGDAILFNRQPTLHRMSMMCHIVKVMPIGDTFRMNVGDTKPYNADFDGDEMNLHMPQDIESESELRNLAAVQWQIISPANNQSIVGIFQDSLLGSARFTRPNLKFTTRETMNLLMKSKHIDIGSIPTSDVSSFDILSQILPPLSVYYKTKRFNDADDIATSNNIMEIRDGKYIRGQLDKAAFGGTTKGLLQRISNDFGNVRSAEFIDDLQNIITEYMKTSAFSVGISDLIASTETITRITDTIHDRKQDVYGLIENVKFGLFENKTGKPNVEAFEAKVSEIMASAEKDVRRFAKESLTEDNRFVIMVNAGSKGTDINISQMISCLGQQNVDGKRIPYGFESRTLPHYSKFDDSPLARGFVENSFIAGLTPHELFFHAMGGRIGLIDTAIKTSQTGYIQRRLIKGMEDLKVEYDMTVRNNKGRIIQFKYGDDGIDPVKTESVKLGIHGMSSEEILKYFQVTNKSTTKGNKVVYTPDTTKRVRQQLKKEQKRTKELIDYMLDSRGKIARNVYEMKNNDSVYIPVAFTYIINNVIGSQGLNANSIVDITPYEAYELIDAGWKLITSIPYVKPTELFKIAYYYYMCPSQLITKKRFNQLSMQMLINEIDIYYKKSIINPGEMVGMIAAQSIGEPTTQMTLNTFHFAGVASKSNVTRGVPRIEEILSLSANPKNPSCTIYLHKDSEHDQEIAKQVMYSLQHTRLQEVVNDIDICFDPDDDNTMIQDDRIMLEQYREFERVVCAAMEYDPSHEKSNWVLRISLNKEEMLERNLTMDDIHYAISTAYPDQIECTFSDYNSDNLIFRIRMIEHVKKSKQKKLHNGVLDQQDEIYLLKGLQDKIMENIVLRGVKRISKVNLRKMVGEMVETDVGTFVQKDSWVLDTVGTNLLGILGLDYIDYTRTVTNDIREIYKVLGIEAARQSIFNELLEVLEFDGAYINYHHLSLLVDRMTCSDSMTSIFRHGINNDDIGPIAKASFEETPEMFLKAARHAEMDPLRGVSANVMCGQEGFFGTNSFRVMFDIDELDKLESFEPKDKSLLEQFNQSDIDSGECSTSHISLKHNIEYIAPVDMGDVDDGAGF